MQPVHIDYKDKLRQHTPLSKSNTHGEWLWFNSTHTDTTSEQEYSNVTASNKAAVNTVLPQHSQNISGGTRSYAFSSSTKHV